jgi:hypothetical protein
MVMDRGDQLAECLDHITPEKESIRQEAGNSSEDKNLCSCWKLNTKSPVIQPFTILAKLSSPPKN